MPTILKSTDTGAPGLTGEAGSLYDVLKWALPQLGWTIEFDNSADKIVFRNSGLGSGYYLRVLDNDADHAGDARRAKVEGYDSMSDIDTGTSQYEPGYWVKSQSLDSTPRDWFVAGTDQIFYIGTYLDGSTTRSPGYRLFWAGDLAVAAPSDPSPFSIGALTGTGTSASDDVTPIRNVHYGSRLTNVGGSSAFAVSFSALTAGQDAQYLVASPDPVNLLSEARPGSVGLYPDPITSGVNTSRVSLFVNESSVWAYRASLPGLLVPMSDLRLSESHPFSNLEIIPGLSNGKGIVNQMLVQASVTFGLDNTAFDRQAFLIDTESDWGQW